MQPLAVFSQAAPFLSLVGQEGAEKWAPTQTPSLLPHESGGSGPGSQDKLFSRRDSQQVRGVFPSEHRTCLQLQAPSVPLPSPPEVRLLRGCVLMLGCRPRAPFLVSVPDVSCTLPRGPAHSTSALSWVGLRRKTNAGAQSSCVHPAGGSWGRSRKRRPKPGSGPLLRYPKPALLVSQHPIQRGGRSPAPSPRVTDEALRQETASGGPCARQSTRPKWAAWPSGPWPWLRWWVLSEPSRAKLLPQREQK